MSKVSMHESESYADFIARKTKEEDNKSSIIPSIHTHKTLLESNKHIDDMEPAEITIDDKQNTMNIDLNLDAYAKLMPEGYGLMPDSTEFKYVEHYHTTYETVDDVLNITAEGMKFDSCKPDYSLLPFGA